MPTPRVPVALFLMHSASGPPGGSSPPPPDRAAGGGRGGGIFPQRSRRTRRATGTEPAGRADRRVSAAPLAGPVSLRPEILFALKGGRAQAVGGGRRARRSSTSSWPTSRCRCCCELGVRRGRFRPMVFGGPAPALQIGCDLQVVDPTTPVRATCDQTGAPAVPAVRHRRGGRRRTRGALAAVLARPRGPLHQRAPLGARAGGCPEPGVRRGPRPDVLTARVQLT